MADSDSERKQLGKDYYPSAARRFAIWLVAILILAVVQAIYQSQAGVILLLQIAITLIVLVPLRRRR